jgi:hypothetical protein
MMFFVFVMCPLLRCVCRGFGLSFSPKLVTERAERNNTIQIRLALDHPFSFKPLHLEIHAKPPVKSNGLKGMQDSKEYPKLTLVAKLLPQPLSPKFAKT